MTNEEQLTVMRKQLSRLDGVVEKTTWMATMFDPDPAFTQENRDTIRGEICQEAK